MPLLPGRFDKVGAIVPRGRFGSGRSPVDSSADRQKLLMTSPYCVLAVEAVEVLQQRGFRAFRLEQSVRELHAAGIPVAAGEER